MFASSSVSVSSLTYVNHLRLGLFLTKYKGWSNETWYTLTSDYDHLCYTPGVVVGVCVSVRILIRVCEQFNL